ncbi:protein FAR1-RELATED SEQUENCE 5-like [Silene latifolia]|uniref:protein FAR1-RELATED SEQUENCE 5-like n=1 Tax=Silene latifolia TaxID=37657 RepID=UPI003D7831C0
METVVQNTVIEFYLFLSCYSDINVVSTPGGTEQWVRTVESDFTPKRGMFFLTLDDAVQFYNIYALACGFDVRRQGYRDMKRKLRLQATNHEADNLSTTENKERRIRQPKKNALTRVDHNKKTVTFAVGLLDFESQDSFEWIFKKILEAMGAAATSKMPEKVGRAICNDTEFMTDINAVVWDVDLETEEFEQNCETFIKAHGMQSNLWLKYVFAIRQKWIPAYFRDLPLGCLLRTTQRSESSNSYFKRVESHFGTLVEFWMRYNSAIEQQRHSQRRLSNEVKHAICSMGVGNLTTVGTVEYHDVRDGLKHIDFRVDFNTKTNESKCACKLFERHGIVCRHILWVWNGRQAHRITEPYVLSRGTKKSYRPIVRDENGNVIEDIDEADIKKAEMSKEIEALLGITASNDIDLRLPNKAKNKGSGKRFRSSKEKANSKPQKRKRRCGNCKKWVNHNSRTCNLPFAESPPSDDDYEEESETEEVCEELRMINT